MSSGSWRRVKISCMPDTKRELLRHLVATIAFRANVSFRDAPETFGSFQLSQEVRTPAELVGHLGDLMTGSLMLLSGEMRIIESSGLTWTDAIDRFRRAIRDLEDFLASDAPISIPIEKLIQGPVADSLTHVGQIVMLRRAAGFPVRSEPYFQADIAAGRDY